MSEILSKVRKLNWMLQESQTDALSYNDMCEILSDLLKANVYVTNTKDKVIGMSLKIQQDSIMIGETVTGQEWFSGDDNGGLLNIKKKSANICELGGVLKHDYETALVTADKLHAVIPIVSGGNRWGMLTMARYEPMFSDEDLVLGEYGATIVGLEIQRTKIMQEEREAREISVVQMAIDTLSYSEIEAVRIIFGELGGNKGILVASKIADRFGITRSVIVNALRKLESAGVIESRSLGMKGTRIKILNKYLKSELEKLDR